MCSQKILKITVQLVVILAQYCHASKLESTAVTHSADIVQ